MPPNPTQRTNSLNQSRHDPTHTLLPYFGLNEIILAVIAIRITVVANGRIGRPFAVGAVGIVEHGGKGGKEREEGKGGEEGDEEERRGKSF